MARLICDIRNVLISTAIVGVSVAAVAGVEEWTSSGPEGCSGLGHGGRPSGSGNSLCRRPGSLEEHGRWASLE